MTHIHSNILHTCCLVSSLPLSKSFPSISCSSFFFFPLHLISAFSPFSISAPSLSLSSAGEGCDQDSTVLIFISIVHRVHNVCPVFLITSSPSPSFAPPRATLCRSPISLLHLEMCVRVCALALGMCVYNMQEIGFCYLADRLQLSRCLRQHRSLKS